MKNRKYWPLVAHTIKFQNTPSRKCHHVVYVCSTADDRVHPSHARRFVEKAHKVAKDERKAKETILYHEMTEGGHAGHGRQQNLLKIKTIELYILTEEAMQRTTIDRAEHLAHVCRFMFTE